MSYTFISQKYKRNDVYAYIRFGNRERQFTSIVKLSIFILNGLIVSSQIYDLHTLLECLNINGDIFFNKKLLYLTLKPTERLLTYILYNSHYHLL